MGSFMEQCSVDITESFKCFCSVRCIYVFYWHKHYERTRDCDGRFCGNDVRNRTYMYLCVLCAAVEGTPFWSLRLSFVKFLQRTHITASYLSLLPLASSAIEFTYSYCSMYVQPLLCSRLINNGVTRLVSRERIRKHVLAATNTQATIAE
jgi:hypothetical protein